MQKINALVGPWLDQYFYREILPILNQHNIPTARQETIPIIRLYDKQYWGGLRSLHRISLAMLDYRHWYYDDETFHEYVKQVSSVKFPAVCLFECPFGYERPNIDVLAFEKKLYERTKMMADAIHNKQPETVVVSPAISLVSAEFQEKYLDYFIHNRSLFDAYALHICYGLEEQSTNLLSSLLNQVVRILRKPVWVTKWGIPSCDHSVHSPKTLGQLDWDVIPSVLAATKAESIFNLVDDICLSNTKWFFASVGKDVYHRDKRAPGPSSLWEPLKLCAEHPTSNSWNYTHFLGMSTFKEEIKKPILDVFLKLAAKHNV